MLDSALFKKILGSIGIDTDLIKTKIQPSIAEFIMNKQQELGKKIAYIITLDEETQTPLVALYELGPEGLVLLENISISVIIDMIFNDNKPNTKLIG